VAGLNYTFDELPVKWLERIETILEYSQENILAKRRHSEYGAAIGFFSLAFRNALTGRLRFKFSEETQLALSGTANFESAEPGHYLQLKLTRKLTDAFQPEELGLYRAQLQRYARVLGTSGIKVQGYLTALKSGHWEAMDFGLE